MVPYASVRPIPCQPIPLSSHTLADALPDATIHSAARQQAYWQLRRTSGNASVSCIMNRRLRWELTFCVTHPVPSTRCFYPNENLVSYPGLAGNGAKWPVGHWSLEVEAVTKQVCINHLTPPKCMWL